MLFYIQEDIFINILSGSMVDNGMMYIDPYHVYCICILIHINHYIKLAENDQWYSNMMHISLYSEMRQQKDHNVPESKGTRKQVPSIGNHCIKCFRDLVLFWRLNSTTFYSFIGLHHKEMGRKL